jgi:hypothetical protein
VVRRIKGLRPPLLRALGTEAEPRWDVVRGYLRFFGPATPKDAAAFLDAPVKDVAAHWPEDVEPTTVLGVDGDRSILAEDVAALSAAADGDGTVRLLGPYDGYLQLRDRPTLVDDKPGRKTCGG